MLSSIAFTAADIDAMQAGRDLDALIVSFVFKVADFDYRDYRNPHFPIKKFSTDIAAAWEVVESLRARGMQTTIDTNRDGYQVATRVIRSGFYEGPATVSTLPLAICRAALRAVLSMQ